MSPWVLVAGDLTHEGGMDRANHALASFLCRRGAEVHVVAHRVSPRLDVQFHRVARPLGSHLLGMPLLACAGTRRGRELARRGARVVTNGGNCAFPDVSWIHYVHAAWRPRPAGLRANATHAAFVAAERKALSKARVVITNSERTRRDVIALGVPAERVHVVYYGADGETFRPAAAEARASARRELGFDGEVPVVAFVGALGDRRKGFDTVLEAWRALARKGWDARLAVIGAGRELDAWRARAADLGERVRFLGFRRDVPRVLQACDALVAPTRYEAYGLGVQEALCCGLPAIVSRAAGVAERYPRELEALLVDDPDDSSELASRLERWRAEAAAIAPVVERLGARLRERTWDRMGEELVSAAEAAP